MRKPKEHSDGLRGDPRGCVDAAVADVGVHGVLAILHDCFTRNLSRFESYPIIQKRLTEFDAALAKELEAVLDPLDQEAEAELRKEWGFNIVHLHERQ